jgi:hypothetical protein
MLEELVLLEGRIKMGPLIGYSQRYSCRLMMMGSRY